MPDLADLLVARYDIAGSQRQTGDRPTAMSGEGQPWMYVIAHGDQRCIGGVDVWRDPVVEIRLDPGRVNGDLTVSST